MFDNDPKNKLPSWMSKLLEFITGFITLVSTILGFVKLWQGSTGLVTIVLITLGVSGLLLGCAYFAFKKVPSMIEGAPDQPAFPRARLIAKTGLIVVPVLTLLGLGLWLCVQNWQTDKIIVLVADFTGPEPQKWAVTEKILEQLEQTLVEEPHVKLKALGQSITPQEGSEIARKLGQKYKATLVIWGWYAVTEQACNVSVHFEVLKEIKGLPKSKAGSIVAEIAELQNFVLQIRLSSEMSNLTIFILGLLYYNTLDYEQSERYFTKSFSETVEAVGLLDKRLIHFLRGNSRLLQENYADAISDYTKATELDSNYTKAYNNRGFAYWKTKNYSQAFSDYIKLIELDPNYISSYVNLEKIYIDYNKSQYIIFDSSETFESESPFKFTLFARESCISIIDTIVENHYFYDTSLIYFGILPPGTIDVDAIDVPSEFQVSISVSDGILPSFSEFEIINYIKALKHDSANVMKQLRLAVIYFIAGETERLEQAALKAIEIKNAKEDIALSYYILALSLKLQGKDTQRIDIELMRLCSEMFQIDYSFDEIQSWLVNAEIEQETKAYIQEKTEMMKKHQK